MFYQSSTHLFILFILSSNDVVVKINFMPLMYPPPTSLSTNYKGSSMKPITFPFIWLSWELSCWESTAAQWEGGKSYVLFG